MLNLSFLLLLQLFQCVYLLLTNKYSLITQQYAVQKYCSMGNLKNVIDYIEKEKNRISQQQLALRLGNEQYLKGHIDVIIWSR